MSSPLNRASDERAQQVASPCYHNPDSTGAMLGSLSGSISDTTSY